MADSTDCKTYDYASAAVVPHTPGPWLQSHHKVSADAYSTQVYTSDGEVVCTLHWYPKPNGRGNIGTYREANARLIAAAPDLLAACKALQMEAAARHCGLRIADEAIAKAEGR